jgi:hypothetical protein
MRGRRGAEWWRGTRESRAPAPALSFRREAEPKLKITAALRSCLDDMARKVAMWRWGSWFPVSDRRWGGVLKFVREVWG